MKNSFILFILLSAIITACNLNTQNVSEPNSHEINTIRPLGDQVSKELISSLQEELKKAIKSGGMTKAIKVCNLQAIPITEIVANSTDMELEIKRTSFQYRNELNTPNEYEELALNYFQSEKDADGNLPTYFIQKIESNDKTEFYYYKPLVLNAVCLNCHGTDEKIPPETKSLIQKLYPEDKATGYQDGDFRGLVRIKFPDFQ